MATFYTVSFLEASSNTYQVSRFFNSVKAARKWATWLLTLPNISEVSLYRGQSGGELLERRRA